MSGLFDPIISEEGVVRPTHLEIQLGQIVDNYHHIQQRVGVGCDVMAILKANAYGHGMLEVARTLQARGCRHLGLAYLEEGIRLRQAGIQLPILILGGIIGSQIPLFLRYNLSITASSIDKLRAIDECAQAHGCRASVHLKIDTGMERIGVHYYSASKLLDFSLGCKHVDVKGIFSHFANADAEDLSHARLQLERFLEVLDFYRQRSLPTPLRHIANSGAILQLPESYLDMVRPGLLLFGYAPSEQLQQRVATLLDVRPALRWVSRVVYFKVVQPNHPVSYGSTWESDHMVRVVTIPVGYGDGYHRRMSGQARLLIGGQRYPVVGSICMDQIMVNIEWNEAYNGDEVVLLGEQGEHSIGLHEMARWAQTIPYEILTSINTRVPRVYREKE